MKASKGMLQSKDVDTIWLISYNKSICYNMELSFVSYLFLIHFAELSAHGNLRTSRQLSIVPDAIEKDLFQPDNNVDSGQLVTADFQQTFVHLFMSDQDCSTSYRYGKPKPHVFKLITTI